MKNKCYLLISCVLYGLLFPVVTKADEYQIRYLNSKNIIIGIKPAVQYMLFSDNDRIVWPKNEKDVYMRLWNLTQHKEEYRPPREKKKSDSSDETGLYTKGTVDSDTLPMLDSLNIIMTTADKNAVKFEARWISDNYKEKIVILPRSKDESSICLTRKMLDIPVGEIRNIEIWVWKEDDDEGCLWKVITVEVVPLM